NNNLKLTPVKFYMHQNYPNPFKNTTTIEYALAKPSKVTVSIYNIRGQLVKRFKVGDQDAGYYDIVWNGKNEQDRNVGNGVYFYKLKADMNEGGSFEKIKKVLMIR
ncbi:MAG: T9SS type A sorting domain-containing protein, partial [Candidatus Cloacimonetes bacterium]|nr:T9SS type A sorting domain-containing protein [Candidatus Cloacimonadota bacterium]